MDSIIFESGTEEITFQSGEDLDYNNNDFGLQSVRIREARTVQQIQPLEYFDSSFLFYGMAASVALVTMGLGMTLIIRLFKKA